MWVEIKKAPNLIMAEMWQDLFEGEGIPTRLMPESGLPIGQILTTYRVLVPEDKKHVVEEILRKL
jgi:hypothetical protein